MLSCTELPLIELRLIREQGKDYTPISVSSPEVAIQFLSYMKELPQEQFVALHLNAKHEIIGLNIVSQGTLSGSLVHPREVFKAAFLSNAFAILVAHNHPAGTDYPSGEDITVTKQLIASGKLLGVNVVDHVIVGNKFTSLRSTMPELWGEV